VDETIGEISSKMRDVELAWLFSNCLPNTLDTTVLRFHESENIHEMDSFIITGDIAALWLRDSTNQEWIFPEFSNLIGLAVFEVSEKGWKAPKINFGITQQTSKKSTQIELIVKDQKCTIGYICQRIWGEPILSGIKIFKN
jgi:hypothetical protein